MFFPVHNLKGRGAAKAYGVNKILVFFYNLILNLILSSEIFFRFQILKTFFLLLTKFEIFSPSGKFKID